MIKNRLIEQVKPYTMIGHKNLSNIYKLATTIEKKGLEGDYVEFGCWKGGSTAIWEW